MYKTYYTALVDAASLSINPSLDHFENTFAPVPPPADDSWMFFLIDLATLGTAMGVAPFFSSGKFLFLCSVYRRKSSFKYLLLAMGRRKNKVLKSLPYYKVGQDMHENLKDTSMTITTQSTTIAKDVMDTDVK